MLFHRVFAVLLNNQTLIKKSQDQILNDQIDVCIYYLECFTNGLDYLNDEEQTLTRNEFKIRMKEIIM
jgi:hypothetical protein